MAAIEFAGQLRCLSDLGQLPARRKEKKLGWPSSFLNGGCYIDRTLDGFFFNPTFWYIQYYFLLYLISSGGRKRVRGRKRKRPAARLICFASCSAPQMVVNAVAGRQAPIREVAQTHTAAAAIMDLSLWTSSYLYGRLYGVISVWRGRTTQNG